MSGCGKIIFLLFTVVACAEGYCRHGFPFSRSFSANAAKPEIAPCSADDRYRRADGSCNNLNNPDWGTADSVMPRFLPNAYEDGVSKPRQTGKSGNKLPGARTVSVNVHGPSNKRAGVMLMVMQWGQFVDHDLTIAPQPENFADCCDKEFPGCWNIQIPEDDVYFQGRTCMPFARSYRTLVDGVEEASNHVTAYLDGSQVYGSSEDHMQELRGIRGRLKDVKRGSRYSYLPAGDDPFCRNKTGEYCFVAGDERVNEQPALAAMQTIWMREHNRIADALRRKFHWDDEKIFQETRKIVSAEIQHITFDQFLPIVIGPEAMKKYGLSTSFPYTYSDKINPGIRNEFSAAAFRFGHSLIPESLIVDNQVHKFKDLFMRPTLVLNHMSGIPAALADTKAMAMDRQFAQSITRHLFQEGERTGFDLIAVNLQRGRDHAIQPYNVYREFCGKSPMKTMEQMFPGDKGAEATYEDPDDVDLFTGGVAEESVEDGLLGNTLACILGMQFHFLRYGDRHFYMNLEGPQAFTPEQLAEIQKVRLSKVICENSENKLVQENIFMPSSKTNPVRSCRNLPGIDLNKWANV